MLPLAGQEILEIWEWPGMGTRFSGQPEKRIDRPERPAYFPVEPVKTGTGKNRSFSTGTARKIPGSTGEKRNHPEIFRENMEYVLIFWSFYSV